MQEMGHQLKLEMVLLIQKDVNPIVEVPEGTRDLRFVILRLVALGLSE